MKIVMDMMEGYLCVYWVAVDERRCENKHAQSAACTSGGTRTARTIAAEVPGAGLQV